MTRGAMVAVRVRRKVVWGGEFGRLAQGIAVAALALISTSCGDLTRQGTASSYLIVSTLEAASGADPATFGGTLNSDVVTVVDDVPTVFNDLGRVRFRLAMKDSLTQPTTNNFITVNRYRVNFVRADGRNTPGVDVPYPFDGAFTGTVGSGGETTIGFELVRHIAKAEAPLAALARNLLVISTIAEVTFYGRDQTGREVIATARIGIDFANFGDPN